LDQEKALLCARTQPPILCELLQELIVMPTDATADGNKVFRSAEDFEAAMFPQAVKKRAAASEAEHPRAAGSRLAEEALARLKRAAGEAQRAG
jgi:hypothetical protein